MSPPRARCARRPWVGATAFLFYYAAGGHGTCQGAGRWGWAGALSAMDGGSTSSHSRCRSHALLRKPRAPSHQHPHPAASRPPLTQGLPPPDGSTRSAVAPTHVRLNVSANGPLRSPTMGRRYRFSLFYYAAGGHGTCQGAGRWGCAGALSAMDGAKRGPHGCGCCRPPRSPTARPPPRNPLFAAAHREGVSPVRQPHLHVIRMPHSRYVHDERATMRM